MHNFQGLHCVAFTVYPTKKKIAFQICSTARLFPSIGLEYKLFHVHAELQAESTSPTLRCFVNLCVHERRWIWQWERNAKKPPSLLLLLYAKNLLLVFSENLYSRDIKNEKNFKAHVYFADIYLCSPIINNEHNKIDDFPRYLFMFFYLCIIRDLHSISSVF